MADESNDVLDAQAEPLWLARDMDRLIQHFRPYVQRRVSMAISRNQNLDREDATQCGLIGLWKALGKFDPSAGVRFTTFAQLYVDGAIVDSARDADTAPTKLRAAEKRGEVELPVMFPWQDGFDFRAGTDSVKQATDDVRELLESVKGTAVERDVALWLQCNGDLGDMAAELGVSVEQVTILWKSAAEKLKDPQAYMDAVKSQPAYVPPTEGPAVQGTLFE